MIVHVPSSKLESDCSDVTGGLSICIWIQRLNVSIDAKKYELLRGPRKPELLHLGDYKAKVHKEDMTKSFEYSRSYDFIFSDGSTSRYMVVGESEQMRSLVVQESEGRIAIMRPSCFYASTLAAEAKGFFWLSATAL